MNDIIIEVERTTGKSYCENNKIGVQHANLQNKIIFKLDEMITGTAWLEYEIDGEKYWAEMEQIEDGYQIDVKSCLLVSDYVNIDLKITENRNADSTPIFVSTITTLYVYESIGATDEEPEQYPSWYDEANELMEEMNSLKETVETNETTRQTNETTRINNETTRISNENQRISAENTRIANDTARENRISSLETQTSTNATNIANEITNRTNADINLQGQIDAITSASDVVDIVGTYTELQSYDTSSLTNDDVIKVLQDSTHNNALSYYRWVITNNVGSWSYIGSEGPFYTKSEVNTLLLEKQNTLTFDTTPTSGSSNPVTSGGVKVYVDTIIGDIDTVLDAINGEVI